MISFFQKHPSCGKGCDSCGKHPTLLALEPVTAAKVFAFKVQLAVKAEEKDTHRCCWSWKNLVVLPPLQEHHCSQSLKKSFELLFGLGFAFGLISCGWHTREQCIVFFSLYLATTYTVPIKLAQLESVHNSELCHTLYIKELWVKRWLRMEKPHPIPPTWNRSCFYVLVHAEEISLFWNVAQKRTLFALVIGTFAYMLAFFFSQELRPSSSSHHFLLRILFFPTWLFYLSLTRKYSNMLPQIQLLPPTSPICFLNWNEMLFAKNYNTHLEALNHCLKNGYVSLCAHDDCVSSSLSINEFKGIPVLK